LGQKAENCLISDSKGFTYLLIVKEAANLIWGEGGKMNEMEVRSLGSAHTL